MLTLFLVVGMVLFGSAAVAAMAFTAGQLMAGSVAIALLGVSVASLYGLIRVQLTGVRA